MRLIDAEPLEEILRSRCAQYSNDYDSLAGAISGCLKLVQAQPTISPPPNAPLTLEQLREMDGEPVYVKAIISLDEEWCIVKYDYQMKRIRFWAAGGGWYDSNGYGDRILAYKEGTA